MRYSKNRFPLSGGAPKMGFQLCITMGSTLCSHRGKDLNEEFHSALNSEGQIK